MPHGGFLALHGANPNYQQQKKTYIGKINVITKTSEHSQIAHFPSNAQEILQTSENFASF